MTAHMTAAPVVDVTTRSPLDTAVLERIIVGWLRETRHGTASAACWGCPVDAAGLVARLDAAHAAGLL